RHQRGGRIRRARHRRHDLGCGGAQGQGAKGQEEGVMASDPKVLGAKFDAPTDAEFNTRDIEATMATMGTLPYVTQVPTMTGGAGYDAVRHFYENYFVGRVPDDWSVKLISRTVGESQFVDEVMISFTHDCDMPAILPGVKADGAQSRDPVCRGGRLRQ